ncbi:hypothetical protein [Baaleninema simplex]|uniref:hypothetical protein n=1 Tax=Baaleninema simplex TaxID=2862350 RepID=UPI00178C7B08|nr:hypothetical protein [Baaleninema simplex]
MRDSKIRRKEVGPNIGKSFKGWNHPERTKSRQPRSPLISTTARELGSFSAIAHCRDCRAKTPSAMQATSDGRLGTAIDEDATPFSGAIARKSY